MPLDHPIRSSRPGQLTARSGVPVRYVVLAALCTANLLAYVQRNSLGVAETTIRNDLNLTKEEMGPVLSLFFFTYALGQIPTGWLGNWLGTRRALPLYAVASSAASACFALARGLPVLLICRLGLGLGQAGMLPCTAITLSRWFPATQRALASGIVGSALSVGGALGAWLTGVALVNVTWQLLFAIYAVPLVLWAVWFRFWFRDLPSDHPAVGPEELASLGEQASAQSERVPTPWLALARSPATWWICGQQFFRAAGYIFYATWFTTYLQETRYTSLPQAGLLTSFPLLGVVLGGALGGGFADWVLRTTGSQRLSRQGVAVAATLINGVFILLAMTIEAAWPAVLLLTFAALFSGVAGACAYAITIDMGGNHVHALFSTMNMSGNLGALLFPLIIPYILQLPGTWDAVLVTFAAIHFAAAACWLGLNPRGTVFDQARG